MNTKTKKIISIIFLIVGFIVSLVYALQNGFIIDEYECPSIEFNYTMNCFFGVYTPVFGIGTIMYFIADMDKK